MRSTGICLAALWCASYAFAQGVLPAAKIEAIEKVLSHERIAEGIPGVSIAVADSTGLIWSNGYGISDLENGVAAKAESAYRTASLAKPITAVAAMQLVAEGKLDLDAPIDKYLPTYPVKTWPVTTRQLLGHLAGVRSYRNDAEMYITQHYWSLADAVKLFESDPLEHEPGTKYLYSTFGYVLAGRVLEAAAGESFMDLMRKRVLLPAGMRNTQADDVYSIIPNRSRGYTRTGSGEIRNAPLADTSHKIPGGGLVSTAPDMVRFTHALGSGKLLSKELVEEMFRPLRLSDGKSTGYGVGWTIGSIEGHRYVWHTGGQAGVSTFVGYLPEQQISVAMMFNLQQVPVVRIAGAVVSILLQ